MKVRFELKLFLPYLLPRDSKTWGREAFEYERDKFKIGILVLPLDEAKAAPKPPEGFVVKRTDSAEDIPTFQITKAPHTHFYEVLLVVVTGNITERTQIYDNNVRAKFMNTAICETRPFLDFCRALARDTEIFFDTPPVKPDYLTFDGFPHQEGWFDPKTGAPLGDARVNFSTSEFVQGRSGVESAPWHKIRAAVRSGDSPPLHILTLLDTRKALARNDDRQAVLLAAIAVEVGIKSFLQTSRIDQQLLKDLENSFEKEFWKKYFDVLPKLAGVPSLKDANAQLFENVARLFRVRNKIAHEGVAYLMKNQEGKPAILTRQQIAELVENAEKTIDWITSLS